MGCALLTGVQTCALPIYVDISGGSEAVKYFISGGYLAQNGMIRDFSNERAEVNSNYYFRRYNFRSNLDIQAQPSLKFRLDATGRFGEITEPGTASSFNLKQPVNSMENGGAECRERGGNNG